MAVLYADTSAIIRAYLADEPDYRTLNRLFLEGDDLIITSELTAVEFNSAVASAHRAHRLTNPEAVIADFTADCSDRGAFNLLRITSSSILPLAKKLVLDHVLGALDAIHLATALVEADPLSGADDAAMVTRDQRLATAAKACGLRVI